MQYEDGRRGWLMTKESMFLLLFFVILCQVSLASDAARMTLPSGMDNPLTLSYPELAKAPAPTMIKEGLRATYEEFTGSGREETWEQRTYVSGDSPGAGLVQVDVVALEGGKAATWTSTLVPDPTNGAMKIINSFGSVGPGGCGDFWCNPEVLHSIPDRAGEDLTVNRGTYDLGGQEYDVIRFYYTSPQGIVLGMIYDLNTGIMLHHTADVSSSFSAEEGKTVTRRQNGIFRLRNLRQVNIPWTKGSVPTWAVPGQVLSYQGQHAFWLPQLPDVAPSVSALGSQLAIQEVHNRFAEGRQQTYTEDAIQPAYVPMVSGLAQLMGFWVPKEALSLSPGLVDTDPDTNMKVSVIQSGPDGLIMEKTNDVNYKLLALYDANGKLVQTSLETYSGTSAAQRDDLQLVA
jgi:hypothetical protein